MIPASGKATTSPDDETAIKSVISKYQDALNASSTDQAVLLYVDDGVFMRPEIPKLLDVRPILLSIGFLFQRSIVACADDTPVAPGRLCLCAIRKASGFPKVAARLPQRV
jgi:hypothetical protein